MIIETLDCALFSDTRLSRQLTFLPLTVMNSVWWCRQDYDGTASGMKSTAVQSPLVSWPTSHIQYFLYERCNIIICQNLMLFTEQLELVSFYYHSIWIMWQFYITSFYYYYLVLLFSSPSLFVLCSSYFYHHYQWVLFSICWCLFCLFYVKHLVHVISLLYKLSCINIIVICIDSATELMI